MLITRPQLQAAPLAHDLVHDCRRFLMAFRHVIEEAPKRLYVSALLFSPSESVVRQSFEDVIPRWVRLRPRGDGKWGPSLRTFTCS